MVSYIVRNANKQVLKVEVIILSQTKNSSELKSVGEKLKRLTKEQKKKERFITARMLFSTLVSIWFKDRGKVPDNIGNNILIGNNIIVTKNSITGLILVKELSEIVPKGWTSSLIKYIKQSIKNVKIDIVIKNEKFYVDPYEAGMMSRERMWYSTLNNPLAYYKTKKRAARLLFSLEVARQGDKLYKSRILIYIRTKTGTELDLALKLAKQYFREIDTECKIVSSDIATYLDWTALISSKRPKKIKDISSNVTTITTLSEMYPLTQGLNDKRGVFLGIDRRNGSPYFLDIKSSSSAKNMYVTGFSGAGKTFIVLTWILDMYTLGFNIFVSDIKGNEFTQFANVTNGLILSMRQESTKYVNTFKMSKEDVMGIDYAIYYNTQFSISVQILLILAGLEKSQEADGVSLIEEFLRATYAKYGILSENPNTWVRSNKLNPYVIYDEFKLYLSNAIIVKYKGIAPKMLERYSIYLSRDGSQSHMFRDEYSFEDIHNSKVVVVDFGMLTGASNTDETMFKVKQIFTKIIKNSFIINNKAKKEWTANIDEESNIAADFVLDSYAEDFALRRSQNVVNILLGNSFSALQKRKSSQSIIDNINLLCIGIVNKSSRDALIDEFSLDNEIEALDKIQIDPEYDRTFLLINKMKKSATNALLRMYIPEKAADGKLFKVVDTESKV